MSKIVIFGYELPHPQLADLVLYIAALQTLIFIAVWAKYHTTFRKFIYDTFVDVTGRPDAKLLTAFAFSSAALFLVLRGSFFIESWPPEWLFNSILIFIAALLGLDAGVSASSIFKKKNGSDFTRPDQESSSESSG